MNNKGFTLTEVLVIVVVIAFLSIIATNSYLSYVNTSKKELQEINETTLRESGLSYAVDNLNLEKCRAGYFPNDVTSTDETMPGCQNVVTTQTLIDAGYFLNKDNICKPSAKILIFNYVEAGSENGQYQTIVETNACFSN